MMTLAVQRFIIIIYCSVLVVVVVVVVAAVASTATANPRLELLRSRGQVFCLIRSNQINFV